MIEKLRPYLDRRVALMLALGFSCGLPFLLVAGTFTARLATADIDIKAIGLFAYLLLPYSFKFLWAPVVDALDLPVLSRLLGRRRAWMVLSQICVGLALLAMAAADPLSSLGALGVAAFLMAFSAATQDIVIDAWRIESVPVERQGLMLASYQLGYRLALITAGAGALVLVSHVAGPDASKAAMSEGWRAAYLAMAGLMLVGITASLLAPAPPEAAKSGPREPFRFGHAVAAPVADLYRREGPRLLAVLALVAFYRLPDFVSGVMANPFYIRMGYSLPEIAAVSKLYGIWIGMLGAFVGGWAIVRYGLFPVLVVGAIAGAASNLAFSWLAMGQPEVWRLIIAISVDNFSGTFAGTALMAYMSGLTGIGFAATQYALLSSLYALPGKLVSGLSGFMVAAWGFPVFFAATAAIGIPVVILCLFVGRDTAAPREEPAPDAVAPPRPA
ncbi:MFS transporter [Enterovirga sp.]|uniref:AmpG family muropeptide MFS transporter n=1 Tax=Enterovirga sp. TaxID=2026350 RepID=UPI002C2D7452|nr:MFS transporter [Enterovirga sp.]HMO30895.1 MFS transporter [Enterovirga sp.]